MVNIPPGLSATVQQRVEATSTASAMVSGTVDVLGTPELVRLMEAAAVTALADHVPPGWTTVGVAISAHHTAPTPIGLTVRVTATLAEVQRRRLKFDLVAHDDVGQIGDGTHERVLVDVERFMAGAVRKQK
jgi:fluoroacetyl-CoA thioesterase